MDQYHQQDQKLIQEVAELVLEVVVDLRGNRSTQRAEGNVTGRVARSTDGSQSQNSGKASKISNIRNLLN